MNTNINKELFIKAINNYRNIRKDNAENDINAIQNQFNIKKIAVSESMIHIDTNTCAFYFQYKNDSINVVCNNVCRDLNDCDYIAEMNVNINVINNINVILELLTKIN